MEPRKFPSLATVILAALACFSSAPAGAQPLAFLDQWPIQTSGVAGTIAPACIACDAAGNVLLTDDQGSRVLVYTSQGTFLNQFGSYGSGAGQFQYPSGIAVNAVGQVYVADCGPLARSLWRIQRLDEQGTFQLSWTVHSYTSSVELRGVTVGASGTVFSVDPIGEFLSNGNFGGTLVNQLKSFNSSGTLLATWGDQSNVTFPVGVAAGRGSSIYAADQQASRIDEFTTDGSFIGVWGTAGTGPGQFSSPQGVACDPVGHVFVADTGNNRIEEFDQNGTFLAQWGTLGTGHGNFNQPTSLAVAPDGSLFVLDAGNGLIQEFGLVVTPAKNTSWGRIKALYR